MLASSVAPWVDEVASASALRVDTLLGIATLLCVLGLVCSLGLLIVRRRRIRAEGKGRLWLVAFAVAAALGSGLLLFVYGLEAYVDLRTPPKDALEIRVTGQRWKWLFTYSNGLTDDVLHVPLGTSVRLLVTSNDVVHSLFIPALRVKVEAGPGRVTELWFRATLPGEFPVSCAEYCGSAYHAMQTKLVVHGPGGYDKWLDAREKELLERPPADLGRLVAERQGCLMCHTIWGGALVGPTLLGIYRSKRRLSDGSEAIADDKYLLESTLDPELKLVVGYPAGMPSYRGKLSPQEQVGLVEYMKTLK